MRKNGDFQINENLVVQDSFYAEALSPYKIISNYKDGFSKRVPALVQFKFSINGKDNENPPGQNHFIIIKPENGKYVTPVYKFGKELEGEVKLEKEPESFLPRNTSIQVLFRLDMRDILNAFEHKGYYETYEGEKVYPQSFMGVFIAGDTEPLSWNFGEIQKNQDFIFKDPDEDSVYECSIIFKTNDYRNINDDGFAYWELKKDINHFPRYHSKSILQEALYNMSLEELLYDIRADSTFMAGAKWHGVWTRDISYSIYLSLALIEPEIAKKSLMQKVSNGRIIQDTGTGGSYPVSTDRVVWVIAAWEIYLRTGDFEWLAQAARIIKNSLDADLKNAFDKESNLMFGESSFLDWREQSYPTWMDPKDIYNSRCLGTNVLHYEALVILSEMLELLGENNDEYVTYADIINNSINAKLWVEDKGYYGQYLYGRTYDYRSIKSESLGEALSVIFGVADSKRSKRIIEKMPVTKYGVPCFYPQIKNILPYHNDAIWPFVISYYTWAAAKVKNENAVKHGINSVYRAAALFLTNKENMVIGTGHFEGTEINSNRMLWSIAGNLGLVYRVFFGINLSKNGMFINPCIPEDFGDYHKLENFKYRNAEYDIEVRGHGSEIRSVLLDGEILSNAFFHKDISGKHKIQITMSSINSSGNLNLVENCFAPETPQLGYIDNRIVWNKVQGSVYYKLFKNGELLKVVKNTSFNILSGNSSDEFTLIAVDGNGLESFISEPVIVGNIDPQEIDPLRIEYSTQINGYRGNGYVETNKLKNQIVEFNVDINKKGKYKIDFRYANGNGPINTKNACAIRTLEINNVTNSVIIFPQRGEQKWDDWGYSNSIIAVLDKGSNKVKVKYLPVNENMNVELNDAVIDGMRITLLKNGNNNKIE